MAATLPLKASRKRKCSVIHFLWAKGLNAQILFTLRYVQYMVTSVLLDQQYMCKKFACGWESLVDEKDCPVCCFDD